MKIIRLKTVCEKTGLSRSAIYALIRGRSFPRQISLNPKTVGWIEGEVDAWLAAKVNAARNKELMAGKHSQPLLSHQ